MLRYECHANCAAVPANLNAGHLPPVPSRALVRVQASSPPLLASLEPQSAASSVSRADAGGVVTPRGQQVVSMHPLRELSPNGSVADGVAAAGGGSLMLTPRGTQEVRNRLC